MHWDNPGFIIPAITGLLVFIVGIIFFKRPPKKINGTVGYRTKRSRASQEAWDFSQKFSAVQLMKYSMFMLLIGSLQLFLKPSNILGAISGLIIVLVCIFLTFSKTERALIEKFGE